MKFYVVVREKPATTSNYEKNTRYECYQEAVDRATELAGSTNASYIILEAFERVSPVFQVKRELLHPMEAL